MMRKQGWEAVMRIRVSEGLAISDYYGNFNMWTEDDMEIVAIDCDKAVAVQFKYTKDLLNKPVSVQAALLYTNQVSKESALGSDSLLLSAWGEEDPCPYTAPHNHITTRQRVQRCV